MKRDSAQICREGTGHYDGLHCGDLYDTQDAKASLAELVFALVAIFALAWVPVVALLVWLVG